MRRAPLFLFPALVILVAPGWFVLPARVAPAAQQVDPQFGPERNVNPDPVGERLERERRKAMNKERQESLKKDTDRLLALATELKERVDKTDENRLSLEVIRKAEEIEKLARQVREKMKAEYLMPSPAAPPGLVR
jgi:hypothetical protein